MADTTTLKQRLDIRAKAFASDPDLVTDDVLNLAVSEAIELGGSDTLLPVLVDIAFYRVLLQIGHCIDDTEQKAYRVALSQVTDATAPNAPSRVAVKPTTKANENAYL